MKHQSITSLPPSPEVERHSRMLKYSLAMGIRVLCIIAALFVRGWWLVIPALGAVFLPYFAVVIANVGSRSDSTVLRPGTLMRVSDPVTGTEWAEPADESTAGSTAGSTAEPPADESAAADAGDDRPRGTTGSRPRPDRPDAETGPESWCA